VLADHLPADRSGRVIVIGAGKAAAAMAEVIEREWRGEISGLVVTRYGHGANCSKIEVVDAGSIRCRMLPASPWRNGY
jgi:glycerate 2-kinase